MRANEGAQETYTLLNVGLNGDQDSESREFGPHRRRNQEISPYAFRSQHIQISQIKRVCHAAPPILQPQPPHSFATRPTHVHWSASTHASIKLYCDHKSFEAR